MKHLVGFVGIVALALWVAVLVFRGLINPEQPEHPQATVVQSTLVTPTRSVSLPPTHTAVPVTTPTAIPSIHPPFPDSPRNPFQSAISPASMNVNSVANLLILFGLTNQHDIRNISLLNGAPDLYQLQRDEDIWGILPRNAYFLFPIQTNDCWKLYNHNNVQTPNFHGQGTSNSFIQPKLKIYATGPIDCDIFYSQTKGDLLALVNASDLEQAIYSCLYATANQSISSCNRQYNYLTGRQIIPADLHMLYNIQNRAFVWLLSQPPTESIWVYGDLSSMDYGIRAIVNNDSLPQDASGPGLIYLTWDDTKKIFQPQHILKLDQDRVYRPLTTK